MNSLHKYILTAILALAIGSIAGCSSDPVGEEPVQYAKLSVTVVDELGNPLNGIKIVTYPETASIFTDENGKAVYEEIETGKYQIVASRSDIPIFFKERVLKPFDEVELVFVVATKVSINVFVKDMSGQALTDTRIATSPHTSYELTDEEGFAIFKNVPIRNYTFIVERNNVKAYKRNIPLSIVDGKIQDIEITIANERPIVNILNPENHDIRGNIDITFSGEGFDFEDGEIPGESLVWSSDINGELGIGKEINVPYLSVGSHTIQLSGIDSHGNTTYRYINLNLYYDNFESYFPIPWGTNWNYRHVNSSFTIINREGDEEIWTLKDVNVRMKSVNSRETTMDYSIYSNGSTKNCIYIIEDFFETDFDNIYVSKTAEEFIIWDKNTTKDNPKSEMNIEMTYNPPMTVVEHQFDPLSAESVEKNILVDVKWIFDRDYRDTRNYTETIEIMNRVEIGDMETVQTDFGTFDAAVITIHQGDTERKWWLAKGIGIVRFDYNTLHTPVTALLNNTNISTVRDERAVQKNPPAIPAYNSVSIQKTLRAQAGSVEEKREIVTFLRRLAPR